MATHPIVECVPNFSEGKNREIVARIVASMQVEQVHLLDWSLDATHNRSVVTLAGSPEAVVEAAVRAVGVAAKWIDLTRQNGVHPRIGAADVVPFVPVSGLSLVECAVLARQAGLEIWRRYGVPVYFYGAAAARPDRVKLEDVRRGQFEGLREAVRKDTSRRPDIGGPELHETAGASAVGARNFLIAYNIYLNQTEITAARAIAREIRSANGGLHGVKAIGVLCEGRAQVAMNITDYRTTSMATVHAKVQELAEKHGAKTAEGELIGLIPQDAYDASAAWVAEIPAFRAEARVLEHKLRHPMDWPCIED